MLRSLTVLALGTALLAAGAATAAPPSPRVTVGSLETVAGMPTGVPAAARRPETALPTPKGWPFGESFPRTSGTERLGNGASYWSDFLYDDHGAATVPQPTGAIANLAPTDGSYTYPDGPAAMNGADVFRNAVGLDAAASYWRVDWNTLQDPSVPLAVWGLDTNASTQDGVRAWPAGAGVSSPGLERALVVSGKGAWLVDARTGARKDVSSGLTVDRAARSFVVRVPRTVLPVSGTWRVRLVAGLANAAGDAMAPAAGGVAPGGTAVYNVSYRTVRQEPQQYKHGAFSNVGGTSAAVRATDLGNYWMEDHQAEALSQKDVAPFALDLTWSELGAKKATPEPLVTGYSNRWLVSRLDLGQGVIANGGDNPTGDLRPNFLGRVQPYAVYVPTTYRRGTPTPLTWMLHSLGVNHNQYGALDPNQVQQTCEDRRSICATTLGRGPDMWYFDEAEVDVWEVWNRVAHAYTLDPDRTVVSGYSMGGYASYKLGLAYPDLFAKAMPLAGPPTCGVRVVGDVRAPGAPGRCTDDGDTLPLVRNARELQYVISSGAVDELVPLPSVLQQVQQFDTLGYRYHFELYPAEGHLDYAAQDAFAAPTSQLGRTLRTKAPATVDYTWYPHLSRADLGIGPTGAYWVRDLSARTTTPGTLAHVVARSAALPDHVITVHKTQRPDVPGDPSPAVVTDQTWQRGALKAQSPSLSLGLTGVRGLRVDAARAGLATARRVALAVTTDGASTVALSGLRPGAVVVVKGVAHTADRTGALRLTVR
ncbi:MAG: Alpha/beta hydrolase family protein [Frankiales bacterium]|nr:Alpha/beta hydrolase family protein [Frankiales bacterium]